MESFEALLSDDLSEDTKSDVSEAIQFIVKAKELSSSAPEQNSRRKRRSVSERAQLVEPKTSEQVWCRNGNNSKNFHLSLKNRNYLYNNNKKCFIFVEVIIPRQQNVANQRADRADWKNKLTASSVICSLDGK